MRSQRDFLINHLHRGLHRGQRSMTAKKGRTYDRTAPLGETSEKALASVAIPHMTLRDRLMTPPQSRREDRNRPSNNPVAHSIHHVGAGTQECRPAKERFRTWKVPSVQTYSVRQDQGCISRCHGSCSMTMLCVLRIDGGGQAMTDPSDRQAVAFTQHPDRRHRRRGS